MESEFADPVAIVRTLGTVPKIIVLQKLYSHLYRYLENFVCKIYYGGIYSKYIQALWFWLNNLAVSSTIFVIFRLRKKYLPKSIGQIYFPSIW